MTEAMTPDQAERIARERYPSEEVAVIGALLLLLYNGTTRETRFKAARALEWFDPLATEVPARPATVTEPAGPAAEAVEAIRYVLYGWEQSSRARAAARAGALISELAAGA